MCNLLVLAFIHCHGCQSMLMDALAAGGIFMGSFTAAHIFGVSLNVQILQMDTVITDGYRSYRIATDITLAARTCRRSLRTAMSTGVWVLEVLPRQAERVQRGRFVHPTTPPPSLLKRPPHLQSEASFGRQRECWCGLRSLMLLLWPNLPLEPAS